MSGVITLENSMKVQPSRRQPKKADRAMPQEQYQFEEEFAGWVDDQLFDTLLASMAFAEFEESMDDQLESLVAQWSRWAAPNALAVRRSVAFPSAKPSIKSTAKPINKPK